MKRILKSIGKKLASWLWPEVCPFCGNVFQKGICPACKRKLRMLQIQEPRCMRCGKPIRHMEQEYCYDCMHDRHIYDRGISLWLHREPVNTSIYQFKYHNQRRYGIHFAEELCRECGHIIERWRPELVMPIPLHRKRRRQRGYNQAEILAKEVGKRLGLPVDCRHLVRHVYTAPQKILGHGERKGNVRGAFSLTEERLNVRRVLLIDDIYTTGNTMDEAARVLKRAGVEKVYFLTISIGQGY